MLRVRLVVLERDVRAVLRGVGELGIVHLLRTRAGPDTAPLPARDRSRELARCAQLRGRIDELRQSLDIKGPSGVATTANHMTIEDAEKELALLEGRAAQILKRRRSMSQRLGEIAAVRTQLAGYGGLDLPLAGADRYSFLHFVTGSMPASAIADLKLADNVLLVPLQSHEKRKRFVAVTSRSGGSALDAALQAAGFRREALPAVDGATVDTLAAGTEREAAELTAELGRAERETQALAVESAPLLAQIENAVGTEQRLLQAEQEGARTETTVVLAGWVPTSDMPALERCVREITGGRCAMEATAPDEVPEEQVPVLLRHSRLLRPFSMLVSAYGLPRYREIAPTLFVAISYVLMFGMMFGDTGQGLVLALAGLAMLLAGRSVRMRDLGLLLLTCGISSAGFGVIYGSCFGLAQFKQYALWHDPLEGNPLSLMLAAVGIGVVMISLGLLLNIVNRFRRGDIAGGFLDKFGVGGMLFYWGGLALLAKYAAGHFDRLPASALTLCLVLPLAAWVLREPVQSLRARHTGGALAALAESLVGAFETVQA
jgi:V/A-type H+-transporting ATPase subunit I